MNKLSRHVKCRLSLGRDDGGLAKDTDDDVRGRDPESREHDREARDRNDDRGRGPRDVFVTVATTESSCTIATATRGVGVAHARVCLSTCAECERVIIRHHDAMVALCSPRSRPRCYLTDRSAAAGLDRVCA